MGHFFEVDGLYLPLENLHHDVGASGGRDFD